MHEHRRKATLSCGDTGRRWPYTNQGEDLRSIQTCWQLDLGLSTSRPMKTINVCCLSRPVCGILYGSLSRLRQGSWNGEIILDYSRAQCHHKGLKRERLRQERESQRRWCGDRGGGCGAVTSDFEDKRETWAKEHRQLLEAATARE